MSLKSPFGITQYTYYDHVSLKMVCLLLNMHCIWAMTSAAAMVSGNLSW